MTTTVPYFEGCLSVTDSAATTSCLSCPTNQNFIQSGNFADCLPSSSTAVATTCYDDIIGYANGGSHKCGGTASCVTFIIAQTTPMETTLATRYLCAGDDWLYGPVGTLYRDYAVATTSTDDFSTTSSSTTSTVPTRTTSTSSSQTTQSTHTTQSTQTSQTSHPTQSTQISQLDNSSASDSTLSGGAIAGIVLGTVAVILFAVILARQFFPRWFNKRKAKAMYNDQEQYWARPQHDRFEMVRELGAGNPNDVHEIGSSSLGNPKTFHGVGSQR